MHPYNIKANIVTIPHCKVPQTHAAACIFILHRGLRGWVGNSSKKEDSEGDKEVLFMWALLLHYRMLITSLEIVTPCFFDHKCVVIGGAWWSGGKGRPANHVRGLWKVTVCDRSIVWQQGGSFEQNKALDWVDTLHCAGASLSMPNVVWPYTLFVKYNMCGLVCV